MTRAFNQLQSKFRHFRAVDLARFEQARCRSLELGALAVVAVAVRSLRCVTALLQPRAASALLPPPPALSLCLSPSFFTLC